MVLDWWAIPVDRDTWFRPAARPANSAYQRISARMREEIAKIPGKLDPRRIGWRRRPARWAIFKRRGTRSRRAGSARSFAIDGGKALRADLDRLMVLAIIPERAETARGTSRQHQTRLGKVQGALGKLRFFFFLKKKKNKAFDAPQTTLFSFRSNGRRRDERLCSSPWPVRSRPPGTMIAAVPADAHVTKIQIMTKGSPTFSGYWWPGVGQCEKIVGKAFGELDPKDPKNAVIVDLQLAPKERQGQSRVFVRLLYSEADRSEQGQPQNALRAAGSRQEDDQRAKSRSRRQRPGSVTDPLLLANAFLMPQGYSIIVQWLDSIGGKKYSGFQYDHHAADRQEPGRIPDHRSLI